MLFRFTLFLFCVVLLGWGGCQDNSDGGSADEPKQETPAPITSQLDIDEQSITRYLEKNNITNAQKHEGIYYTITEQGNGGAIVAGDDVIFEATGKFLNDSPFYSSKEQGQPLEIFMGQNMVVPGLEEGLTLLQKGGKATLYLPSEMGYGEEGQGAVIPPNTVLIYEIEVLEVKKQVQ